MSDRPTHSNFMKIQEKRRNTCKECLQNFMEIDLELTEKSAKNQRWWKLTAAIYGLFSKGASKMGYFFK